VSFGSILIDRPLDIVGFCNPKSASGELQRDRETDADGRTGLAGAEEAALAITGKPHDISKDLDIIQGAIAGEHAGIAAYHIAGASGLLTPETLKVATLFKSHHEGHRDALAKLVSEIGVTPVEPKSDDDYVADLKLAALTSQGDILTLATMLERGAASGYISRIATIRDPGLAQLFAQISADEMIHWTTLNGAVGGSLPAEPFTFG
jgi:hypothetical protein